MPSRASTYACRNTKQDINIFPMFVSQHAKEVMISRDGPSFQTGGTRIVGGETLAGWGAIARSPSGRIDFVFRPVITTEALFPFSQAKTHSNNSAEMTAMMEALLFLGPRGPVARYANSCIYCHSKQCCWFVLGHDSSRHACSALACQQSMLGVQHFVTAHDATRVPHQELGE